MKATINTGPLRPTDWQLEYLFQSGPLGWLVHAGVAILTSMAQEWPLNQRLGWCITMLVLSAAMMLICASGSRGSALRAHGVAHTFTTGLVALTWTAGAFIASGYSYDSLLFFTLALGGTALGAVASQHSVLRSCLTSIWLSVPGLAYAHTDATEGFRGETNGLMIGVYALVLSFLAQQMNRALTANRALSESLQDQIKEAETLRQMAERAAEAKTRFLAYVSHDLRQPVHTIGLQVEAMSIYRLGKEPRRIVDQIDVTVRTLSNLFQSLLDLSALELERLRVHRTVFDLGKLIAEVAEQNRLAIDLSGGVLVTRLAQTVYVETDRALLGTVIQNLVGNAVKHAPGSPITIGLRTKGNEVSVVVMDRGPGMDQSTMDRIFGEFESSVAEDPFSQHHRRQPASYGLGLALVRRLVDVLGYSITCKSWFGHGAIFVLGGLHRVKATAEERKAATAYRLHGVMIALYDNDKNALAATKRLLTGWGCDVICFDSAAHPVPRNVSIIISDYRFGETETARTILAQIDQLPSDTQPGFILVSGADPADYSDLIEARNLIALRKPARPAQLRASLTALSIKGQNPISRPVAAAAARVATPSVRNTDVT